MTDQTLGPARAADARPGKRDRLVNAATRLLHQHGVERTTLADIAQAADVPPGNVYYYFKTKDEVVTAVIDSHARQVEEMLAAIEVRHHSPKARLKALVHELAGQSETVTQYGCPLGGLCAELDKRADAAEFAVANLMKLLIDWAEQQLRDAGHRRAARSHAIDLIAAYEGLALITNTLRDAEILTAAARRLERWIDTL